jgi:hypothetical protein
MSAGPMQGMGSASNSIMVRLREVPLEKFRTSRTYRSRLRILFHYVSGLCSPFSPRRRRILEAHLGYQPAGLCEFIQFCKDQNLNICRALQTKWRWLRGKLGSAWGALSSWQCRVVIRSCTCVTLQLAKYLFMVSMSRALERPDLAKYLICVAISIRAMFAVLLRKGETMRLELAAGCIVTVLDPKNQIAWGRAQSAFIQDGPGCVAWLGWLASNMAPLTKLGPSFSMQFDQVVRTVVERAGVYFLCIVGSVFRTGGATHRFILGEPFDRLHLAGRWRAPSSLQIYIQEFMTFLNTLQITPVFQQCISACVAAGSTFWDSPFDKPWQFFFLHAPRHGGVRESRNNSW